MGCDGFIEFYSLCGMIRSFNVVFILSVSVSILYCLSL